MVKRRTLSKTDLYNRFTNMTKRCYDNENYPQYKDCIVCEEWTNDKNKFFTWVNDNFYIVGKEQMDLDKDILAKGNKLYSPDTCIFVPHRINTAFEFNCVREPIYIQELQKWKIDIYGKVIGYFDTEEEAKLAYIQQKELQIKELAEQYKRHIPKKLYQAMISWKIELADWDK